MENLSPVTWNVPIGARRLNNFWNDYCILDRPSEAFRRGFNAKNPLRLRRRFLSQLPCGVKFQMKPAAFMGLDKRSHMGPHDGYSDCM